MAALQQSWPLAIIMLISLPLLLGMAAFTRVLKPGMQLLLGVPLMLPAVLLAALAAQTAPSLPLTQALGGWATPLGIQWLLDVPGMWMLATVNAVTAVAALAAWRMGRKLHGSSHFWTLWWLLWGGMNALAVAADLFNIYVTLELITLAAVGLVAQSRDDTEGKAAMAYLLASLLASLLYLLGVALIYGQTGALDLQLLENSLPGNGTSMLAALLITLGLLLKAAVVPLHFWLPMAHSRAQPPVSAVLSGVVVAIALFMLWRLWLGPFRPMLEPLGPVFATLGGLSLIWGGLQALIQTRLKLLLAYSTLSQLGYAVLLLVLVAPTPTAPWEQSVATGGLVFMFSHGLAKAALFLSAGALVLRFGHDDFTTLRGRAAQLPLAWLAMALAGISLVGVPPTGGFTGKWLLFKSALASQQFWIAALMLLGTALTAGYVWRMLNLAAMQAEPGTPPAVQAIRARRLSMLALLSALGAWVAGPLGMAATTQLSRLLEPLSLDPIGLAFLLPALLIWPVVIALSHHWQARAPLAVLLGVGACLYLLLVLAQDIFTFYAAYALLSLLGWALVVHDRTLAAERAGRNYLAMMIAGELAFFVAVVAIARHGPGFDALAAQDISLLWLMLLAGALAIKAGVLGAHHWLPQAHPAAPTAASAVLSGLLIKAGVLGWLRLMPEQPALEQWGPAMITLGLAAAFYGVVRGLMQQHPKRILAWSSISQMGLITALLGGALHLGDARDIALTAVMLLMITHALAKAALFLGVELNRHADSRQLPWLIAGMLIAALTLAGAPVVAGSLVKHLIEQTLTESGIPAWTLILSSTATFTLLLHLLNQLLKDRPPAPGARLWTLQLWWLLVLAAALLPWAWSQPHVAPLTLWSADSIIKGLVPLVMASGLAWFVTRAHRAGFRLPRPTAPHNSVALPRLGDSLYRSEQSLCNWQTVGVLLSLTGLALAVAGLSSGHWTLFG